MCFSVFLVAIIYFSIHFFRCVWTFEETEIFPMMDQPDLLCHRETDQVDMENAMPHFKMTADLTTGKLI